MAPATVLLADDDDDFRLPLRKLLVQEGYDVIDVADGAMALELLAEAADGKRTTPDIVLLDVMMPGCSGLGILSAMRRFEHRPTTLLLTSFADASVDVVARRLGAARVFHKPIDVDDVLASLRTFAHGDS
jgi:DNA-binding response OmpR family regulator